MVERLSNIRKFYRIMFITWSILLFTLTTIPKLPTPPTGIVNFDKLAHLFFYFFLAFFFVKMHDPTTLKTTLNKTLKLALIVPLVDELHQIPISGRTFSGWDVLADMLGIFLVLMIFKIRKKKNY